MKKEMMAEKAKKMGKAKEMTPKMDSIKGNGMTKMAKSMKMDGGRKK